MAVSSPRRVGAIVCTLLLAPAPCVHADGWALTSIDRTTSAGAFFQICNLGGECDPPCSDDESASTTEDGAWSEAVAAACQCAFGVAEQVSLVGERLLWIESTTQAGSCPAGTFGSSEGSSASTLDVAFTLSSPTTVLFRAIVSGDCVPVGLAGFGCDDIPSGMLHAEVSLDGPVSLALAVGRGEDSALSFIALEAGSYSYAVSLETSVAETSREYHVVAAVLASLQTLCDAADLDRDGTVDGADLGLLLADWGRAGSAADLDLDGMVDGADLGHLLAAWGCS